MEDSYRTLAEPTGKTLYKEKGSKFFSYAYPVSSEEEITSLLDELKATHRNARHWCYAWQLGAEQPSYRVNDDGEPRNSAGMPIYGQIQSFDLTNVLIVVVRYFGGIKLGIGGLIKAYKTAAQMALEKASITERTIDIVYELEFEYALMNTVMRVIKENNLNITEQEHTLRCKIKLNVRQMEAPKIENIFSEIYGVGLKKI